MSPRIVAALAVLALGGCATTQDAPLGAPHFSPIRTEPSAHARLYADCIVQAAAAGRYGRAYDEVHVVVFTCDGDSARAFFDALAGFSAAAGSEVAVGDRVIRSTTRIERDLFAADYCERRDATYRCAITLRTGEFVVD